MRRTVLIMGWTLVWSGLMMLGFVGYQLYGTGLQTAAAQADAREELAKVFASASTSSTTSTTVPPDAPTTTTLSPTLVGEEPVGEGEPFAQIRMPSIDVDQIVFEGVQVETLKQGPGRIPGTSLPGQPGNAGISGHRTTYGQPFHDLDQLRSGDSIFVDTAIGTHEYVVRRSEIVTPFDVDVLDQRDGAWLTLTTCHPKYSARQRLIVFAEMVDGPNLEAIAAGV